MGFIDEMDGKECCATASDMRPTRLAFSRRLSYAVGKGAFRRQR